MSEEKDFDEIINNMGDADNDEDDFERPIDVVAHYWKHFNKGHIFIKGILIVESETPDGRVLQFETTSPCSEWEMMGMIESVKSQMNARNVLEYLAPMEDDEEDEDD